MIVYEVTEITSENANELLLAHFSVAPYNTVFSDNGKGVRVACDLPTVDGFCARHNITPKKLGAMLAQDTIELCEAKFKHIMVVNGTNRGYDAGFSSLVMKNIAGWAEKSTNTEVREIRLLPEDRAILEGMGLKVIEGNV